MTAPELATGIMAIAAPSAASLRVRLNKIPPEHAIPAVHSAFGFVDAKEGQPYSWDDSLRSARPKAGTR
jgi:hypothetical protein